MSENETLVHGNLSKAKAKKGETPSIEFKYDEVTGELSFRSNGILVDKGYVSSHGLVTKAELEEVLKKLVPMAYVEIKGGAENWKVQFPAIFPSLPSRLKTLIFASATSDFSIRTIPYPPIP